MRRKLRILHICSSRAWGGAEISAVNIAKNLAKRGHEIIFIAHPKGRMIKELQDKCIKVIPLRLLRHFDLISVLSLISILNNQIIDLVHVHLSRDLVHIYWANKFSKKAPVILQKQVSSSISKKDFFHQRIYSIVSKVIVLSNFLKDNVIQTCPVSSDKVIVIPGSVQLENFNITSEIRQRIREEWKVENDTLVFGTIGRIDRGKGYIELIQAFSKLIQKGIKIRLIIVGEPTVGEPTFAKELDRLIKQLELTDMITFTGYRTDVANVLSAFDIFVLASYQEAYGYVLIEALAASLPVIATKAGGVTDIIEDNVSGLLVPPRDGEKLQEAMYLLYKDESLRKQLARSGRSLVENKFVESKMLEEIENLYYDLISMGHKNSTSS